MTRVKIFISATFLIFLASCANIYDLVAYNYDREESVKNADIKVDKLIEIIKDAELKGENHVFGRLSLNSGCMSVGEPMDRFPNENIHEQSLEDFKVALDRQFTLHSYSKNFCNSESASTGCVKHRFQLGNGATVLALSVFVNSSSYGSCSHENVKYSIRYSMNSLENVDGKEHEYIPINMESMRKQPLMPEHMSGFNNAVSRMKNGVIYDLEWMGMRREDRAEEYAKSSDKRAAYRAKQQAAKDRLAKSQFDSAMKRTNSTNFFTSNNTNYITGGNGSNQASNNYSTNQNTSSNNNSALLKSTNDKSVTVRYYLNKDSGTPKKGVHECFGKESIFDLESKYRSECHTRYGKSANVASQCATQARAKANNTWKSRYQKYVGKQCPVPAKKTSNGDIDQ